MKIFTNIDIENTNAERDALSFNRRYIEKLHSEKIKTKEINFEIFDAVIEEKNLHRIAINILPPSNPLIGNILSIPREKE